MKRKVKSFLRGLFPNKTSYGLQVGFRELESDLLSSKFLVDAGKGAGLMLNVGLLGFVQVNLGNRKILESSPDTSLSDLP